MREERKPPGCAVYLRKPPGCAVYLREPPRCAVYLPAFRLNAPALIKTRS